MKGQFLSLKIHFFEFLFLGFGKWSCMFHGSDLHTGEKTDFEADKVRMAHLSNVTSWICSARRRAGGALGH